MLVSGLMLGVYWAWEAPREIGCWHLAAAREYWRDAEFAKVQGNLSLLPENRGKAFAKLEDALKWSPTEKSFLSQRALWKLDCGQYEEALEDADHLLARFPDEVALLRLRGKTLHLLGRHAEAVKDAERINSLSLTSGNPPRAIALNELAYAKAVGKIGLESALQEVNEALKAKEYAAFLDTRGFVYYQTGKYDLALQDLDAAAKEIETVQTILNLNAAQERRNAPDIRKYEIDVRKRNEEEFAPYFYHRALVHEKLGHAAAAAADRKRVRELIGREGDEKLF